MSNSAAAAPLSSDRFDAVLFDLDGLHDHGADVVVADLGEMLAR